MYFWVSLSHNFPNFLFFNPDFTVQYIYHCTIYSKRAEGQFKWIFTFSALLLIILCDNANKQPQHISKRNPAFSLILCQQHCVDNPDWLLSLYLCFFYSKERANKKEETKLHTIDMTSMWFSISLRS